jgi:serine/threonine protein kinase
VDKSAGPFGDVALGEVIGGYRLDRLLGAGSTSHVFLGTHVRVGRMAAIKVLSPALIDNKDVISRLLQEARVVNDIRHPNIIDIFDFVETESPPRVALVMEYIEGPSLKAIRDTRLGYPQAIGVAEQLIDAVEAAHRTGVIHRDIKPDNLLLTREPDVDPSKVPTLKVVDFGIAKLAGTGGKTATGMMLGTPAYMAPEQVAGRPPASTATDVFAIGEVIYELLSGTRAYPAAAIHETVRAKLRGDIPPLALPPNIVGEAQLLDLFKRCLAMKPQDRPPLEEVRRILLEASAPSRVAGAKGQGPTETTVTGPGGPGRQSRPTPGPESIGSGPGGPGRQSRPTPGPESIGSGPGGPGRQSRPTPGPESIGSGPESAPAVRGRSRIDDPTTAPFLHAVVEAPRRQLTTDESLENTPALGGSAIENVADAGALTELLRPGVPAAQTELMTRAPSAAPKPRIDSSPTNKVMTALTIAAPMIDEVPGPTGPNEIPTPRHLDSPSELNPPRVLEPSGASQLEKEDTLETANDELQGIMQPVTPVKLDDTLPSPQHRAPRVEMQKSTELARSVDEYSKSVAEIAARIPERAKLPSLTAEAVRNAIEPRSLMDPHRSSAPSAPRVERRVRSSRTNPIVVAVIAALLIIATGLIVLNVLLASSSQSSESRDPTVTAVARRVVVNSNPGGARVENAETHELLGFTPVEIDLSSPRAMGRVRISSSGYKPAELVLGNQHGRVSIDLQPMR